MKLSDLSIADLKAALDFTKDQMIVYKDTEEKYNDVQGNTSKMLEQLQEKLENVLWFKVRALKDVE